MCQSLKRSNPTAVRESKNLQGHDGDHSWLLCGSNKGPRPSNKELPLTPSPHERDNGIYKTGENSQQLIHSQQGTKMCSTRHH